MAVLYINAGQSLAAVRDEFVFWRKQVEKNETKQHLNMAIKQYKLSLKSLREAGLLNDEHIEALTKGLE